jgi:small-conductance mechanosensitive channel
LQKAYYKESLFDKKSLLRIYYFSVIIEKLILILRKYMKLYLLILIFPIFSTLFGENNISFEKELSNIDSELRAVETTLSPDNSIWLKSYSNYKLYLDIENRLKVINQKIESFGESRNLLNSKDILKQQLQLFGNMSSPFEKLLHPPALEKARNVTNPFDIFTSLSKINLNDQHLEDYQKKVEELKSIVRRLKKREELLIQRYNLIGDGENDNLNALKLKILDFEEALFTLETTFEIYKKRIDEVNFEIKEGIFDHSKTMLTILITFLVIIGLAFLLKLMTGKYLQDNQRIYMSNKAINFITVTLLILVMTFTYIDNINYLITILGFASAGLAIAMKDGFMSMFGWFVIIFGGAIKVGDRIKVTMSGAEYVGDILDISLLRITLQEDVTLTTLEHNRRAGRIIFVPNNYIFTNLVANYSHYTLRTVWDGIDIIITFDSNHKKAMHIMKEVAKNYSSGYTDMTRKQLNKLRDRYNLRNTNVEPRMFSFIDNYGIKLSVWYLTNAYATLALRSNISTKIIDAFNVEEDIKIAYPTQKIEFNQINNSEVKNVKTANINS